MRTDVSLKVLQTGVGLRAELVRTLVWFLPRVSPQMDNQHVLGLEGLQLSGAAFPVTGELPGHSDTLKQQQINNKQTNNNNLACIM